MKKKRPKIPPPKSPSKTPSASPPTKTSSKPPPPKIRPQESLASTDKERPLELSIPVSDAQIGSTADTVAQQTTETSDPALVLAASPELKTVIDEPSDSDKTTSAAPTEGIQSNDNLQLAIADAKISSFELTGSGTFAPLHKRSQLLS
ncbi:hypothetical protein Rs2_15224 [Raphanus sativus]|nr:hypothetical protein Rs2_15224 [Raphanus sativus]